MRVGDACRTSACALVICRLLKAPVGYKSRKIRHFRWNALCSAEGVFRLDKKNDEQRTYLSIAGSLSAECVDLLENCCEQALREGRTVDLALNDVTTIDEAGHALLYRLARRGITLSGNGLYHGYLVESIRQRASLRGDNFQKL
jgi:ABC-type transporter Mla MlaB component